MVKHNNQLVNNHFRKAWDRRVRTWFNQPGRKQRRRAHRVEKAAAIFPRPAGLLRPVVHCSTQKYNAKQRLGRGFTHEELKAAGLTKLTARTVGVSVDHRRRNQNKETFDLNVERIKSFRSKQILFPLNTLRKAKKSERKEIRAKNRQVTADIKNATQVNLSYVRPRYTAEPARAVTEDERKASVFVTLRKAKMSVKKAGDAVKKANAKEKEVGGGAQAAAEK